jgi:hypothetical protein
LGFKSHFSWGVHPEICSQPFADTLYAVVRRKYYFIIKRSKIAPLVISIETVKIAFFVSGVEILQVLGVKVSTGGSTESNVRSFQAFVTIYLTIYLKKASKKAKKRILLPNI